MRVTIKDIARALDLDHSTVSRALADSDRVAEHTKTRVRQMAENLGYRPDARARSLKRRCTETIGVVLPTCDEHDHAYLHHLIALVQNRLAAAGYDAIVAFDPLVDTGSSHALRLATHRKVDGLLIAAYPDQLSPSTLEAIEIPTVFFHVAPPGTDRFARFTSDNLAGGALAATHLESLGHEGVGLVGLRRTEKDRDEIWERQEGFLRHFEEQGHPVTTFYLEESHFDAGRHLGRSLVSSGVRSTALFVISDIAAMGLIRGLQDRGVMVPDDLSVIGYDDLPGRQLFSPLLTTLHQRREDMIRDATDHLIALLAGEDRKPVTRTYPPVLVKGETTRSR